MGGGASGSIVHGPGSTVVGAERTRGNQLGSEPGEATKASGSHGRRLLMAKWSAAGRQHRPDASSASASFNLLPLHSEACQERANDEERRDATA